MICDDFVFFGPGQQRLDQHELPPLDEIKGVEIEWRNQKNIDNGQKIPYTKNKKCHGFAESPQPIASAVAPTGSKTRTITSLPHWNDKQ